MNSTILDEANKYYTEKVITYGATPLGVDWNNEESQLIRFQQILQIINKNCEDKQTILDYGCGYGSLLGLINNLNLNLGYLGYDISHEMLRKAKEGYGSQGKWLSEITDELRVDYVVASGLFNVKQQRSNIEWEDYIKETLNRFNALSVKGFSFNVLTSYSNPEFMKDYLYYADPLKLFDFCKRNFSKEVTLLHDYKLYEFTLLVRK